jgi:hypothetical protein
MVQEIKKATPPISFNKAKARHDVAIIMNMSGHRIPQSVFDGIGGKKGLKALGHRKWCVYSDMPKRFLMEKIDEEVLIGFFEFCKQKEQRELFKMEGERYLVLPHLGEAALLIGLAIRALGFDVTLITIKKVHDGTYQLGKFIPLSDWYHYFRSEGRKELVL